MTLGSREKCIVYVEDTKLYQFVERNVGILLLHQLWRTQGSHPEHGVQSPLGRNGVEAGSFHPREKLRRDMENAIRNQITDAAWL